MVGKRMPAVYKKFFICLFTVVLTATALAWIVLIFWPQEDLIDYKYEKSQSVTSIPTGPPVPLSPDSPEASQRDENCTYHKCFNVYHCGYNDQTKISVYVYPLQQVDKPFLCFFPHDFSIHNRHLQTFFVFFM